MEKLVYCLWRDADADVGTIQKALVDDVGPALLDLGVAGLRIQVEEPAAAFMAQGRGDGGRRLTAMVSLWLDSLDEREPYEAAITRAGVRADGYLVAESVPMAYGDHRTWPDGERSPGLSIMTVFDKRPGLSDEEFFRIWHEEHTPLSFEIHPIWLYVRNTVVRPLTGNARPLRAIVYEAVPTDDDLLDLHRFFGSGGSDERLTARIQQVTDHVGSFADAAGLVTTPAREWIFATLST